MESSIKLKIEYYCSYQERCHFDVINKLNKLGVFGQQVDEYICYLIDENFLSETRYSEAFARGKFKNNNWGRIKIKRELRSKNISDWNITKALSKIDSEEYEKKIDAICKKQIQQFSKTSYEVKNKIIKRLAYKGWEAEIIIRSLNRLIK